MDGGLRVYLLELLREVDGLLHLIDFHADWTDYFEFGDPLDAFAELRSRAERIHPALHILMAMAEKGELETR